MDEITETPVPTQEPTQETPEAETLAPTQKPRRKSNRTLRAVRLAADQEPPQELTEAETLTRHQLVIEKRQNEMKSRMLGISQTPLAWTDQLETTVVEAIQNALDDDRKEIVDALVTALPAAIRQQEAVIASETSTTGEKNKATNVLFFLFAACLKSNVRISRMQLKVEQHRKQKMAYAARKAKHLAIKEGIVIQVARERRKISRVLREAETLENYKVARAAIEKQISETPERLKKLQLRQELVKLRQQLKKGKLR